MKVGFFLALRENVEHYLHAAALVRDVQKHMPGVEIVQLSDFNTPEVPGVTRVSRRPGGDKPLLEQRLEHYSHCNDSWWLLIDTDVSIRNDVSGVFDDDVFDVALCDRDWSSFKHNAEFLHAMPFNTGVVFCRHAWFWGDVCQAWKGYPDSVKSDWMSEQRAVYDVVRTGRYRVKILPGEHYNYPPASKDDAPAYAAMLHYKGDRKKWRSAEAYQTLGQA